MVESYPALEVREVGGSECVGLGNEWDNVHHVLQLLQCLNVNAPEPVRYGMLWYGIVWGIPVACWCYEVKQTVNTVVWNAPTMHSKLTWRE